MGKGNRAAVESKEQSHAFARILFGRREHVQHNVGTLQIIGTPEEFVLLALRLLRAATLKDYQQSGIACVNVKEDGWGVDFLTGSTERL